ncbi:MAG: hypothetical protein HC899_23310 [Leptolyngbyaceae cyanobacterium SM1_4_3]|nr:hypothetical protein [Leptolyngbyaceae cyanobacterium SM1_4_3]
MKWLPSCWWKRTRLAVLGVVLAIALYGLLQLIEPVAIAPIIPSPQPFAFTGSALLVASDADMVATAYADGVLNRIPGVEDTLTVIDLPLNSQNPSIHQVQVSNSVASWPQIIAASPNGTRAFVAEVRGRPPDNVQEYDSIDQLPAGTQVTAVDLTQEPLSAIATLEVGQNPEHLGLSPDGTLLAVTLEPPGEELVLIQIINGTFGERFNFAMPEIDGQPASATSVVWHPSGQYLALNLNNRAVAFYQVQRDAQGNPTLQPQGEPIRVGNWLTAGRFISDGRFYLIPDVKWRTYGVRQLDYLMNPKGALIAIAFTPTEQSQVTSIAEVGLGPEGFAISPDDSLAVTVNLRRTYLPNWLPAWRGKPYSSLSLVAIDRTSGELTPIDEYGFEGLLPEQVTFDAAGNSLAVVIYHYREETPTTGAVEFWRVVEGNNSRLERTGLTLDVVRGAHDIVLIP